ncbi:hypothetical protein ACFV4F_41535 [Kitasatospora sp. NPDC059722]|uniref:hypothetical protein n=1 Tax=unclassified Kitasatospora TaxID=2633591 RepID=UPI003669F4FC
MRTTTRAAGLLFAAAGLVGLTGVTAAQAATVPAVPRIPAQPGVPVTPGIPAQPGDNFVLCSGGTYPSYAVFPKRGGFSTHVVAPHQCERLSLTGIGKEQVVLYGLRPDGRSFTIAKDTFDDRDGERIRTLGTPDADDWTTF